MSHKKFRSIFHALSCPYCGCEMTSKVGSELNPRFATKDHTVPKSRGGHETIRCCRACNENKGHLTVNEWRAALCLRYRRPVIYAYERWFLRNLCQSIFLQACQIAATL